MRKQPPGWQDVCVANRAAPGSSSGVALLITVLILLVVSILGATVVNLGRIDYALSDNYRADTSSLQLADSALQATVADLRADYDADASHSALATWVDLSANPPTVVGPLPDPGTMTINGHALTPAKMSSDPYPGTPYLLGAVESLGSGTYARTIWLPPTITTEGGVNSVQFRVRAVGTDGSPEAPATSVIDGTLKIDVSEASVYSNAMVLGAGAKGQVVNGGALQVAGPVVVLGAAGDGNRGGRGAARGREGGRGSRTGTELEFRWFSGMINGYQGIDGAFGLDALAAKLPALPSIDYNGDKVTTLQTALYLRDAELSLQPTASLGAPDVPGNGTKETLDGIYSDSAIDTSRGNIHTDEIGVYSLGELSFPTLDEPYTDLASGSSFGSFGGYLETIGYQPVGGDLRIAEDTASFSFADPAGRGSISWDADSGTLSVSGVIRIDGDVVLGDGAGGLDGVRYAGTGVLWAREDIRVRDDLYPAGRYLADGPDADNAIDGNLGLVTSHEIRLDGGSAADNLQVFATLYAGEEVDVRSRVNLAGSLVSNHVDIAGLNRLNVWYVPRLAGAAPPGMPGIAGTPKIRIGVSEWFEVR